MEVPFIDTHCVEVRANRNDTWAAAIDGFPQTMSGRSKELFAKAVGCRETSHTGPRPLEEGATIPGFRVVAVDAPSRVTLEGQHRFSSYAVDLRIDEISEGKSRLCMDSRATFPGRKGAFYETLVIRTRFHVVAVRSILRAIKRRAESS